MPLAHAPAANASFGGDSRSYAPSIGVWLCARQQPSYSSSIRYRGFQNNDGGPIAATSRKRNGQVRGNPFAVRTVETALGHILPGTAPVNSLAEPVHRESRHTSFSADCSTSMIMSGKAACVVPPSTAAITTSSRPKAANCASFGTWCRWPKMANAQPRNFEHKN